MCVAASLCWTLGLHTIICLQPSHACPSRFPLLLFAQPLDAEVRRLQLDEFLVSGDVTDGDDIVTDITPAEHVALVHRAVERAVNRV